MARAAEIQAGGIRELTDNFDLYDSMPIPEGHSKTVVDLKIIPEENGDGVRLEMNARGLDPATAHHLAEHLGDGIQSFMDCVGAKGIAMRQMKNMETGEVTHLGTETFGEDDEADTDLLLN
jgi:hypothetical protein